jgi:hypothetical protein
VRKIPSLHSCSAGATGELMTEKGGENDDGGEEEGEEGGEEEVTSFNVVFLDREGR